MLARMEATDSPEGESFVVTQTASELLVFSSIFPAYIVSCITSTCTILHANPRFTH